MNIRECYDAMGGDYDEVLGRLRKEERVKKFLLKVPGDPSYSLLCVSMENKDMEEAFRAAHTLKGISQNLSLNQFCKSISALSDYLKEKKEYNEQVEAMFAQVKEDYAVLMKALEELQ
jgi:tRNA A37 threonylcarbamoyladenosine synthetase subunit TsaC/SUA5/YrdC